MLGQQLNKAGYYTVNLRKDLESYICLVHRLVAIAFIPNPDNLPIVNHKDENTINPNVENLEWCTAEYNVNYGTARERAKETKAKNKLLEQAKQAAKIIEDKKDKTKKVYTKGIDYSDFVFSRKFDNSKPIIVKKTSTVKVKKFHKKHNRKSNKDNSFCNDKLVLKINRHTVGSVSYDITLKTFRNKIAKNN